jgi:hypothetical protein
MKNSFLILSTIILNNFFPTLLMLTFFIFDSNIIGVEIALLTSALNLICQIFSMHGRNIILTSRSYNFSNLLFDRMILSFLLGFILICIINFANFDFFESTFSFVSIILIFWVNEIAISILEKKKLIKLIFRICLLSLFYISCVVYLITTKNINILLYLNIIFSIIFSYNLYICLKNLVSFNNFDIFDRIKFDAKSISSLFLILPVFVWRVFIYDNFNIDDAALYFVCFALASLPGTLLLNVIGVSLIRLNLVYVFKSISIGIIFFIILNLLLRDLSLEIINLIFSSIDDEKFFITLLFSLIGSVFLIFGIFARCDKFLNFQDKSKIYQIDILNAVLVSITVPIIILFFNSEMIYFSFMISGLINFINYKFILK